MIEFTPYSALAGGLVIGLSATLLLRLNGRILGVSGIVNGALALVSGAWIWRALFVAGLIAGGLSYQLVSGEPLISREEFPLMRLIIAGLLVGFGTRLGSGCTSGHGVCGIARLSPRSIVATLIFVATGMLTATAVYLLLGGNA